MISRTSGVIIYLGISVHRMTQAVGEFPEFVQTSLRRPHVLHDITIGTLSWREVTGV